MSENNTQEQQLLSLKPLTKSYNLEVEDQVIAIGNHCGLGDTMTTGIVSGWVDCFLLQQAGDFQYQIQSKLMHQGTIYILILGLRTVH